MFLNLNVMILENGMFFENFILFFISLSMFVKCFWCFKGIWGSFFFKIIDIVLYSMFV